ncbi:hypothetical protein [Pyrinomonas sp.]|uniref:hypothetical protein n=1 Tax=Pyrinomonas sp. TaxID=2080306 RepID=UPI00331DE7B6
MNRVFVTLSLAIFSCVLASAQVRPRVAEEKTSAVPPAPPSFKAKYEGGVLGYNRKLDGMLQFDDANGRLVFRDKQGKEVFSLPYRAIIAAFADTRSRRPTAATVIGSIPAPYGANIPAWFVRKKYRYLTLQFSDPDTNVSGVTSFKIDDKQLLASALNTLAAKAGLEQRGEAFVRKRDRQM